jgi:plasmid stabilization system protein ParE
MSSYQFTPQAVEDLFEIWAYIADDDVDAENHVEATIYDACLFLAETPLAGRFREDLTDLPLRFWLVQTLSELLDRIRPGNQTAPGHSSYSRRPECTARLEVEKKESLQKTTNEQEPLRRP